MNVLVVIAHPDDEVLGAGATIWKLTKAGHNVDVCTLVSEAQARSFRPEDKDLHKDRVLSVELLGVRHTYDGTFPDAELNTIAQLKLVQFIEKTIALSEPDVILTHHPADTHSDHQQVSMACQAAFRLFQRKDNVKPIREFLYMEIPSSTEWSLNSSVSRFAPNTWCEIGEEGLKIKLKALEAYRGVMRPYPHPRSAEMITGLAAYRGAQSGCNYAESFEGVYRSVVSI